MTKTDSINEFLSNNVLNVLCNDLEKIQHETSDVGFNVFTLTSDFYYRENFHSDIIAAFLSPQAKHNEGNLFLDAFIDMLNMKIQQRDVNKLIRKDYYINALVEREKNKIDILIRTTLIEKPHCIIIENKIHNAGDMPNQIPRYYDYACKCGVEVDAIVYLPLNVKTVDKNTWKSTTLADKKVLDEKLINIPAYDSSVNEISLVTHWIIPLISITKNIDCISLLRQYAELIKSLAPQMKMNSTMEKLYKHIINDTNLTEQAKRFISMMKNLPATMANNLIRDFKNSQNEIPNLLKVFQWSGQSNNCVVEFNIAHVHSQIYIYTFLDSDKTYEVCIRENYAWITDEIRKNFILQDNGSLKRFFSFGQEKDVLDSVKDLMVRNG